jgi:hypothetical protein
VTLALAYTAMFVFAFGAIANFGILARERSQLVPFLFVFLALQALPKRERARREPRAAKHQRPLPTISYRARPQ